MHQRSLAHVLSLELDEQALDRSSTHVLWAYCRIVIQEPRLVASDEAMSLLQTFQGAAARCGARADEPVFKELEKVLKQRRRSEKSAPRDEPHMTVANPPWSPP